MEPTKVEDDEALYRAVRAGVDLYLFVDGKIKFSSSAFTDRECKPSVDRSSLRTDPAATKLNDTDGVIKIMTYEVRAISIRTEPNSQQNQAYYLVNAIHRPILTPKRNCAHCQIECDPHIKQTHFNKKLKESLAWLASAHGFVVNPSSLGLIG